MSLAVFSLFCGATLTIASPQAAFADACDRSFMGFPTWYRNISAEDETTKECVIKNAGQLNMTLEVYILQIGLNIVDIAIVAVGYLCAIFILYGGFNFIISSGDSDKMAKARTTLLNASIGLVICIASVAVVRFITSGLGI